MDMTHRRASAARLVWTTCVEAHPAVADPVRVGVYGGCRSETKRS